MNTSNDPLHGKKLADILDELLDYYGGFEGLSRKIELDVFAGGVSKSMLALNESIIDIKEH